MDESRKVVVVRSTGTVDGKGILYWMFSRKQLEMVLREIEPAPVLPAAEGFCEAAIAWQEEILPVVCLEKYFGLAEETQAPPGRHLVLKAAAQQGDEVSVSMIVLPVYTDLQMGSVSGGGKPVAPDFLKINAGDILGAFELAAGKIAILPDICRIASRSRTILMKQGRP